MRIGIDLGGTKIEAIALGAEGEEILRRRIVTPQNSYDKTIKAIRDLVHEVEATLSESGSVGVGIPGTISPSTGLVKNANSTCLIGNPLDKDLAHALDRPVRLENDANCFAISEAADGAAKGKNVVFGVILGTGCGGGLVIDGQAVSGLNRIGGEWGHNPLPWPDAEENPGPSCYCGKYGCIETWLSGPGLSRNHTSRTGETLSAKEIVELATAGDPHSLETLNLFHNRLARALATICNVIDPDVIVLGGGLSNIGSIYEEVPKLIGQYAFSDAIVTPIRQNVHGDSSGVRGAAWLWPQST